MFIDNSVGCSRDALCRHGGITFAALSPDECNVTLESMSQIAQTMPEPRLQRTKKRMQPVRSTPPSHRTQVSASAAQTIATKPEATVKTEKAKKAQRKPGEAIASWWPVAVGMFLCGFAPEWHAMAVQIGVWAERFAFPLTMLAAHRAIGIDSHMVGTLPQAALYLQLPLEGLLTKLILDRGKSLKAAIMQLLLVHGIAAIVLGLISFSAK